MSAVRSSRLAVCMAVDLACDAAMPRLWQLQAPHDDGVGTLSLS